jgi:hypothetical protein
MESIGTVVGVASEAQRDRDVTVPAILAAAEIEEFLPAPTSHPR